MGSLLLIHDFGVDDRTVVLLPTFRWAAARFGTSTLVGSLAGARLFRRGLVEFGRNSLPGFIKLVRGRPDCGGVAALERFFNFVDRRFDLALVGPGNLIGAVLEHLLGTAHCVIGFVARLNLFAVLL